MYSEVSNISEYLQEDPENIVLILPDETTLFCFTREDIRTFTKDFSNNFMYECGGKLLRGPGDKPVKANHPDYPHLGLPIDKDGGMKGFIPVGQVMSLIESKHQVFFIRAKMINGEQVSFSHTASWQVLFSKNPNWVSANHCQLGSNIMVYEICRCPDAIQGGKKKTRKQVKKPIKKKVSTLKTK
jgi:hypothetical protein